MSNYDDNDNKNYEVGFAKPPKSTQFKKGKSGNPNGRPKASKNLATIYDAVFNALETVTINGEKIKATRKELIILRICSAAINGDMRAIREFVKMAEKMDNCEPDLMHIPAFLPSRSEVIKPFEEQER